MSLYVIIGQVQFYTLAFGLLQGAVLQYPPKAYSAALFCLRQGLFARLGVFLARDEPKGIFIKHGRTQFAPTSKRLNFAQTCRGVL